MPSASQSVLKDTPEVKAIAQEKLGHGTSHSRVTLKQSGAAGGYSAGYYSYKWAEVLSADAFSAFEEVLGDDQAVRETGRRFRDTVLALGGGRAPDAVFRVRFGRPKTRPKTLPCHETALALGGGRAPDAVFRVRTGRLTTFRSNCFYLEVYLDIPGPINRMACRLSMMLMCFSQLLLLRVSSDDLC